MEKRLPFYMAYPFSFQNNDDKMERRDLQYMRSMYPEIAKKILPYVEEECERMAYEGSVIFDEYPDRLQIHLMCMRIYDKVKETLEDDRHVREMIELMLFQEICCRRKEKRRQNKYFYF